MLAGNQPGKITAFLFGTAVAVDLVHAKVGMRAVRQPDRRRSTRDFFHRHHMGQIPHAAAAVFLCNRYAEQTEIAQLAPQIHREFVAFVGLGGTRGDFGRRKMLHAFAQHPDVLAEIEIQSGKGSHRDFLRTVHRSGLPCMVIRVCNSVAQSVSPPPFTTKASPCVTTRVRPDLSTRPRAINRSPSPGASRFILYSTVSTRDPSGIRVKPAYPPAESAM